MYNKTLLRQSFKVSGNITEMMQGIHVQYCLASLQQV